MDRIPVWVIDDSSGATDGEPEDWQCEDDQHGPLWTRTGMMAFGRANALYRNKHYRCPYCDSFLRPLRRRAYFACVGCLTAYKWRDGTLTGYVPDSEMVISVEPSEFNFR